MKYLCLCVILITAAACEKQENDSSAAVTILLTNETSLDLFGLESAYDESFFGDIPANESATFDYAADKEFPHGQVYPTRQKAALPSGDSITIEGTGYCGVDLTFSTAAPDVYEFSIRYYPTDTIELFPGVPYVQQAYYGIVQKM